MKEFRPAKKRIDVSVGESVRIIRELQGLSQTQLAELTGIYANNDLRHRERSRPVGCGTSKGVGSRA